jgi:hypothetical protein
LRRSASASILSRWRAIQELSPTYLHGPDPQWIIAAARELRKNPAVIDQAIAAVEAYDEDCHPDQGGRPGEAWFDGNRSLGGLGGDDYDKWVEHMGDDVTRHLRENRHQYEARLEKQIVDD